MSTTASASHPASTPCSDNTDFMSTFNSAFEYWKTNSTVLKARNGGELERENRELKQMLADSLLKNPVLEAVCEKSCEPGASPGGGTVFPTGRLSAVPASASHTQRRGQRLAQGVIYHFDVVAFPDSPADCISLCHAFHHAGRDLADVDGVISWSWLTCTRRMEF